MTTTTTQTETRIAMYGIGGGWMYVCPTCLPQMEEQPDDFADPSYQWTDDDYCECCVKRVADIVADA